jgi:beta-xylosidase
LTQQAALDILGVMKLTCLILSLLVLRVSTSFAGPGAWGDQGDGTYKNPILNADYSDPDVCRVGNDYYMICSEFHFMGMPVLHSLDLVNWTYVGMIYRRLDMDGAYDRMERFSSGTWAPTIRYHEGKFWMFVCTPDEGLYMSTATNAAGPWAPITEVKRASGWEDPCPLWDEDGQAYLGRSQLGGGPIIIHKMSPDGTKLLDDGRTVYEGPIAEGTKLFKRNGCYYLVIPEGGVSGGWQSVCRSTNIYGPYEQKTVLHAGNGINGPHQGGLVDTPSGQWWFLHFQENGPVGRIGHLQPAAWTEDNWITMGVDIDGDGIGEPVITHAKPDLGVESIISAPATTDEFESPTLGLQWGWNHNPIDSKWSLTERPGYLRLTSVGKSDSVYHARNTLTQKLMGRVGEVTTELDTSQMVDAQKAGLCLFSRTVDWVGVERRNGINSIRATIRGEGVMGPDFTDHLVWFRTSVNLDGQTSLHFSLDGTNFVRIGGDLTLAAGNWKGVKPGLFSFDSTEGSADFNWFRYKHDGPGGE